MSAFARRLLAWQKQHGRHDLPWQGTRDPYRIWVSEIMLQQAQVGTVVPYYQRFLAAFPDVRALADAPLDRVLELWAGLGYYGRARHLHRAAHAIVARHDGAFPRTLEDVAGLPGVGRSTAAAICAFAFGTRAAILDGNVKRVLARWLGIEGFPGERAIEQQLWREAEALLPARGIEAYTQALMDLGATVCLRRRPVCESCPVRATCVAFADGRQDELPTPRPRKARPHRHVLALVLQRHGEVLLERRPPTGIWGGLWSLPEVEPGSDVAQVVRERFGGEVTVGAPLPDIAHGFTHYALTITPVPCAVRRWPRCAAELGLAWLLVDEAAGAAVPAPVRQLLRGLAGRRSAAS